MNSFLKVVFTIFRAAQALLKKEFIIKRTQNDEKRGIFYPVKDTNSLRGLLPHFRGVYIIRLHYRQANGAVNILKTEKMMVIK